MRSTAIFAILFLSGCAVRQPASKTWRLTTHALIPPGIAGPEVAQRTFTADVGWGGGHCPAPIRKRGQRLEITVSRESLLKQPDGWLTSWTEDLESQRCIVPGQGAKLAARIAGSLPMDPDRVFRLLYASDRQSGDVDLGADTRLQVVSPIMADGTSFGEPSVNTSPDTTGHGNTLTLTLRAPEGMLGYETALYEVRRRSGQPGFTIVPLMAERHINGETERVPQPATNYFRFSEEASFFRLFYKAGQTDFTALVAGARTRAELGNALDSCKALRAGMCIAIAKSVAVNAMVAITVNGGQALVNWGSNVAGAIRAAGERQPDAILPRLSVFKLYDGRPVAVDFDRSNRAILDLVLTGGESISWPD
jgi:hypothetical protein